jgi:hypothetical protein
VFDILKCQPSTKYSALDEGENPYHCIQCAVLYENKSLKNNIHWIAEYEIGIWLRYTLHAALTETII